jgi:hypothetical protein
MKLKDFKDEVKKIFNTFKKNDDKIHQESWGRFAL